MFYHGNNKAERNVQAKFQAWSEIIDYILEPLGGRQPIAEQNCDCAVCRVDLARVVGVQEGA